MCKCNGNRNLWILQGVYILLTSFLHPLSHHKSQIL
jgi:hypothetical protein